MRAETKDQKRGKKGSLDVQSVADAVLVVVRNLLCCTC